MKIRRFLFCILILVSVCLCTAFAEEESYIVTLNDSVSLFSEGDRGGKDYVVVGKDELCELLDAGLVKEYEPNLKVTLFVENWSIAAIESSYAWDVGCYGNEVRVGVIDSGIAPIAELSDNVLPGKNYIGGNYDTSDNEGHGTFVSGVIASEILGVAPESKIVPLKCFDEGKDTYVSHLLDAIYDAVDIYGCDVINMSFGVGGYSSMFYNAVRYAVNHGAIVVAAVGNYGNTALYYPAAFNNVIGVGSVGTDGNWSEFSQYNSSVYVTAPGEDIVGLGIEGYMQGSGTSFSAPHVSAMAAIAKCIDKDIDNSDFMSLLAKTSVDRGSAGYDKYYGYGIVNVKNLISELLSETEVFMSPLHSEGDTVFGVVYNNSDEARKVTCLCEMFDNNKKFLGLKAEVLTLGSKERFVFANPRYGDVMKYSVWRNTGNLGPSTDEKIFNN